MRLAASEPKLANRSLILAMVGERSGYSDHRQPFIKIGVIRRLLVFHLCRFDEENAGIGSGWDAGLAQDSHEFFPRIGSGTTTMPGVSTARAESRGRKAERCLRQRMHLLQESRKQGRRSLWTRPSLAVSRASILDDVGASDVRLWSNRHVWTDLI